MSRVAKGNDLGRRPRRGAALVVALVLLAVFALFEGVLVRQAALGRRRLLAEERRCQAEWLVESGIDRALARGASPRDDRDETWAVPADELGGEAAVVRIAVEQAGPGKVIRVEAAWPREGPRRVRAQRLIRVEQAEGDER